MTDEAEASKNDKAFADVGAAPIGRVIAQMFKAMVEEGMTRREALIITREYVKGMSRQKSGDG